MPMEAKDIFEANSRTVRELLSERGLGLYVPPYQRPYGWDKDKVAKLVEDTLHGFASLLESDESFTFLGTVITIHDINYTTVQPIVRPDVPAKLLTVIDGQQRLTTLLLFCVALHNHIRLAHSKLLKGKKDPLSSTDQWLDGQARRVVDELANTFHQVEPYGDSRIYPRMIRAFDDQWSRSKVNAKYTSPIAYLLSTYCAGIEQDKPVDFKPVKREGRIEGEDALIERFQQLSKLMREVAQGVAQDEELEEFPSVEDVLQDKDFQRALLNHDFPEDVAELLSSGAAAPEYRGLLMMVLLASYLLNRVAVTVVRGKNEDYAFTVFESLNTTGEPLTAYETFKPRVVSAETLALFEKSLSRQYLSEVSDYLSSFKVGDPLQAATRDLLIYFAAAETGKKLSSRLADQRRYLKEEFERYEEDQHKRVEFVRHLRNVATFTQHAWEFDKQDDSQSPSLHGLPPDATTDAVKLCLAFFVALKHTVVIAPLVRFYSVALAADAGNRAKTITDFEQAIKALAAFSVLWRISKRGTANIDYEYREMLAGNNITALPALARSLRKDAREGTAAPTVDVSLLKAELRARLEHAAHGALAGRAGFIADARAIPSYSVRPVARFVLLAAYHDAVEDPDAPGLIKRGKDVAAPCLTYRGFTDARHLALEHIAPKAQSVGWDEALYADKETVNRLGNLVLVQDSANSSLGNRPWKEKRVLYSALGARSREEAAQLLADAEAEGIAFGDSTQTITQLSEHMPHLGAIGRQASDWTVEVVDARSERLLGLAWDRLSEWL